MKSLYIITGLLLVLSSFGCGKEANFINDSDLVLNIDRDSLNRSIGEVSNVEITVSNDIVGKSVTLEFSGGTINGKASSFAFVASDTNTFTYVPDASDGHYFIGAKIISGTSVAVEKVKAIEIYSDETPGTNSFNLHTLQDSLRLNVLESTIITIELAPNVNNRVLSLEFDGGRINNLPSPISQIEIPSNGSWTGILSTSTSDSEGIKLIKAKLQNNEERVIPINFVTDAVSDIISFDNTNMTGVLADSNSTYDLIVNVQNHHSDQITLTTDHGKFTNGSKTILLDLQGNNSITVPVTTSSVSKTQNINCSISSPDFERSVFRTSDEALPDFLSVTPSSFSIDSSAISIPLSNLSISVLAGRTLGYTTKGLPYTAEAFQVIGGVEVPNGVIYDLPLKTGVNGASSFMFYASPGLDPNFPLFFRVTVNANGGGTLVETTSITVNPQ